MADWKIFYTDGTTLKKSEVPDGDPKNIPSEKRIGVHSILQMMYVEHAMREAIEQYHYIWSIEQHQWVGIGVDGLLDQLVTGFNDISCVLHGRTMSTDRFWQIKKKVAIDTDIPGGVKAKHVYEDIEGMRIWLGQYHDPYYQNGTLGAWEDPWIQHYTDLARHRAYPDYFANKPVYGQQEWRH